MSGQGSVVPAAIASPMIVGPPSLTPQAHNNNGGNKSNTIVLIIVIIAIVVFLIFLFTKLNTQNKQLKELQAKEEQRQKTDKLLIAMAQQMGIRQNQKGEIEFVQETDEDEDDDGECAGNECGPGGVCRRNDEKHGQDADIVLNCAPGPFANAFFRSMPMFQASAMQMGRSTEVEPEVVEEATKSSNVTVEPSASQTEQVPTQQSPPQAPVAAVD